VSSSNGTTTNSRFDRLRSRTPDVEPTSIVSPVGRDAEGKRALFSATDAGVDVPGVGTITIDCARCGERTIMSPVAAVWKVLPSLVLSVGVGRGDKESTFGLFRRHYGAFLRCPSCGRGSWTRITVRL
jgi:hypothetical protein